MKPYIYIYPAGDNVYHPSTGGAVVGEECWNIHLHRRQAKAGDLGRSKAGLANRAAPLGYANARGQYIALRDLARTRGPSI